MHLNFKFYIKVETIRLHYRINYRHSSPGSDINSARDHLTSRISRQIIECKGCWPEQWNKRVCTLIHAALFVGVGNALLPFQKPPRNATAFLCVYRRRRLDLQRLHSAPRLHSNLERRNTPTFVIYGKFAQKGV